MYKNDYNDDNHFRVFNIGSIIIQLKSNRFKNRNLAIIKRNINY